MDIKAECLKNMENIKTAREKLDEVEIEIKKNEGIDPMNQQLKIWLKGQRNMLNEHEARTQHILDTI